MTEQDKQELLYRKRLFDQKWKENEVANPICGTPCWQWIGLSTTPHVDKNGWPIGYGVFRMHDGTTTASRASYRLANPGYFRFMPSDLEVDHICRNHGCVNPDHLQLVTRKVNCRLTYTKAFTLTPTAIEQLVRASRSSGMSESTYVEQAIREKFAKDGIQ